MQRALARADEKRTEEFLGAASRGDGERLRAMLQQRMRPDTADYDGGSAWLVRAGAGAGARGASGCSWHMPQWGSQTQ